MGVQTTADDKIDEAREHIKQAYKCLIEVVDEDTWGSKDYKESYIEKIEGVVTDLRKMSRKL